MSFGMPPGTAGRLQQLPTEKGLQPGTGDPLPGQPRALRERRHRRRGHRLMARVFGRKG